MELEPKELIARMGGPAKVAKDCELTTSAVSQWATANHIPHPWMKYFRLSRPDLFKGSRASKKRAV